MSPSGGCLPLLDYGFLPLNLCLDPACSQWQSRTSLRPRPALTFQHSASWLLRGLLKIASEPVKPTENIHNEALLPRKGLYRSLTLKEKMLPSGPDL